MPRTLEYRTASAAMFLALGLTLVALFAAAPAYAQVEYRTSYSQASARSVTVQTEDHLYRPGETVVVSGSVSEEMRQETQSDTIAVTLIGAGGSVVAEEQAVVDSTGRYRASMSLPENADEGGYSAGSKLEVSTSILGLLEADVVAKLQSSTRFVVANESSYGDHRLGRAV